MGKQHLFSLQTHWKEKQCTKVLLETGNMVGFIGVNGKSVSIHVVEAVIKTLGAIGNKSAFDSLLGVTYLNYPESVLSAAREALAGLKW